MIAKLRFGLIFILLFAVTQYVFKQVFAADLPIDAERLSYKISNQKRQAKGSA